MTDKATTQQNLSHRQRDRFAAFAERLIPGGEGLPSASEAGVGAHGLDRLLNARPDLVPVLATALDGTGDPDDDLSRLRSEDPDTFRELAIAVAGTYMMDSGVRRLFGFNGVIPAELPPLEGEFEFYLEDGILDLVRSRGPIYREV